MAGQSSFNVETHDTNEEGQPHSDNQIIPTKMISHCPVDQLLQQARDLVSERTAEWEINNSAAPSRIPKYDLSGKFLLLSLFCESRSSHGSIHSMVAMIVVVFPLVLGSVKAWDEDLL
jgi:hypothetical protein